MHEQIQAAVAVVEWMRKDSSCFLLLRRTQRPEDAWAGQLAFPGGRVEPQDLSLLHTCLRETREECGLELNPSHLVNPLALDYAGRHKNRLMAVQAFHFRIEQKPDLILQPEEMDAFYWLDRASFSDASRHVQQKPLPGLGCFPGFRVETEFLWGFTYEVLRRLVGLVPASDDGGNTPSIPAGKTGTGSS